VCGKRFKIGLYALETGRLYFVQLWDSPDRELTLMIRRRSRTWSATRGLKNSS
jgi:hypothetical protein